MELLKSLKYSIDDVSGVGKVLSIANGAEFAENLNNGFPIGEAGLYFLKTRYLKTIKPNRSLMNIYLKMKGQQEYHFVLLTQWTA